MVACTVGCTPTAPPVGSPVGSRSPTLPAATMTRTPVPQNRPSRMVLEASFSAASEQISADVSVSVASGADVLTFGAPLAGPAWSTMKVPVAIAAMRASPARAPGYVPAAITLSDNAAAEHLWSLLGAPTDAARAVESVLRDGGDMGTVVQSERIRPGFTSFGQTNWTTEAQASFAWRLPCIAGAESVFSEMQRIVPEQQWGFARDDDAAAKGGWGPASDGRYLVRQLAVVRDDRGALGVAIAVAPHDGSFQSGVAAVNRLANWVDEHRGEFVWAAC